MIARVDVDALDAEPRHGRATTRASAAAQPRRPGLRHLHLGLDRPAQGRGDPHRSGIVRLVLDSGYADLRAGGSRCLASTRSPSTPRPWSSGRRCSRRPRRRDADQAIVLDPSTRQRSHAEHGVDCTVADASALFHAMMPMPRAGVRGLRYAVVRRRGADPRRAARVARRLAAIAAASTCYGPTETHDLSTTCASDAGGGRRAPVPIGRPIAEHAGLPARPARRAGAGRRGGRAVHRRRRGGARLSATGRS